MSCNPELPGEFIYWRKKLNQCKKICKLKHKNKSNPRAKTKNNIILAGIFSLPFVLFFAACSFDYGEGQGLENTRPDIVMENIEYVRVRGGDPLARIQAEHAERWENLQTMELRNFAFEQMEDHGETVNVEGKGNTAKVQLDSGDVSLSGGIWIRIESEDVIISTASLEWKDKEKTLSGNEEEAVDIERADGTNFTGIGLKADIRSRTWSFQGEVKGSYVDKDEDENEEEE